MKRFDKKDPGETVVLSFDFSGEASAVSSPVVSIAHDGGPADSDPAVILDGGAQAQGAKVLQRVKAGVLGADYVLRCTASDGNGNTLVRAGLLMVRAA